MFARKKVEIFAHADSALMIEFYLFLLQKKKSCKGGGCNIFGELLLAPLPLSTVSYLHYGALVILQPANPKHG
jgi:hypothetical protein